VRLHRHLAGRTRILNFPAASGLERIRGRRSAEHGVALPAARTFLRFAGLRDLRGLGTLPSYASAWSGKALLQQLADDGAQLDSAKTSLRLFRRRIGASQSVTAQHLAAARRDWTTPAAWTRPSAEQRQSAASCRPHQRLPGGRLIFRPVSGPAPNPHRQRVAHALLGNNDVSDRCTPRFWCTEYEHSRDLGAE